jgi:hypothetical protein
MQLLLKPDHTREESQVSLWYVSHVILNEHPRHELRRLHSTGKCLGRDVDIATNIDGQMYAQAYVVEVYRHQLH